MTKRLSKQSTSSSTKFRKKKMTSVKDGPILWIDFTDRRTVYSDASDTLCGNNDGIYAVENKAFDKRFGRADQLAFGSRFIQTDSSKRPGWKSPEVAGIGYADFDGTNDFLIANNANGNVGTNLFSSSRIDGQSCTIFWVVRSNSATPGNRAVFSWIADDGSGGGDPVIFGPQLPGHDYRAWLSDASDKSGSVTLTSGEQATVNRELWTIKLAGSGASYFYRNGNVNDGIINGTSKDHEYDFSSNNPNNIGFIGTGNPGYWQGKIYEILMYNSLLSGKQILEIERQLKQKYSIT